MAGKGRDETLLTGSVQTKRATLEPSWRKACNNNASRFRESAGVRCDLVDTNDHAREVAKMTRGLLILAEEGAYMNLTIGEHQCAKAAVQILARGRQQSKRS